MDWNRFCHLETTVYSFISGTQASKRRLSNDDDRDVQEVSGSTSPEQPGKKKKKIDPVRKLADYATSLVFYLVLGCNL